MLKNTKNSYGIVAKLLHWVIGLYVICMLAIGLSMSNMSPSPEKFELYKIHKACGVLLLVLVIIRILWRSVSITVEHKDVPQILKFAGKIGHIFLYILMLVMPLSGMLMSYFGGYQISVFGIVTIPASSEKNMLIAKFLNQIHGYTAWLLILFIILHILAALYHHFIRKDKVLIKIIN